MPRVSSARPAAATSAANQASSAGGRSESADREPARASQAATSRAEPSGSQARKSAEPQHSEARKSADPSNSEEGGSCEPGAHPSVEEAYAGIECLQRLASVFLARRAQLAGEVGLTEHQWGVLEEISSEHFIPSMFARQRDSSAAAVSKTIRQLLDKGLVSVSVSKEDGRQRNYVLTARGKRTMARLRQSRQAAVEDIWLELDRDKLSAFTEIGNHLVEEIEGYVQRSKGTPPGTETASKATAGKGTEGKDANGKDAVRESL